MDETQWSAILKTQNAPPETPPPSALHYWLRKVPPNLWAALVTFAVLALFLYVLRPPMVLEKSKETYRNDTINVRRLFGWALVGALVVLMAHPIGELVGRMTSCC